MRQRPRWRTEDFRCLCMGRDIVGFHDVTVALQDPWQLRQIFGDLEEGNLFLIQTAQVNFQQELSLRLYMQDCARMPV